MTPQRLPPHDEFLNERIELAVAAQLARLRLSPDAFRRYDRRRLFALLDAAARALVRVARIYVRDPATGQVREIAAFELQDAEILDGGNRIVLKDGSSFSDLSIRRGDLAEAIALLRKIGVPGLDEGGTR